MGPALLFFSDGVPGKFVERIPDRPEHLVDVSDAIRRAPPWRQPRDAVMLINHEVKFWLGAVPAPGCDDGAADATATHDVNAIDHCGRATARKDVREPVNFVSSLGQRG